ncbi:MAG: YebC/PmpR family DNA-binding transcriptional regulator [bacterium]|nr:YebC/PmpR family DNA-binding transcriptional regulator [bacterium]
MSGHSKWATIHRQKEINDAKRGQNFTKLGSAITVAIRAAGGVADPESNFRLRIAIEKARGANMPKENIQRAITRATGVGGGDQWEEVIYEGYGPSGIAVMIEAATDNKQRTGQEIKNILEKGGGNLAGPGAVAFQFERKGFLTLAKPDNPEEAMLKIMDLGVEDVEEVEDGIEIYTKVEDLEKDRKNLDAAGFTVTTYELIMKPISTVSVTDQNKATQILNFLKKLEEQADVQRVFANVDVPQEIASQLV